MISRYDVQKNNVSLSSISPKIYVADISYQSTSVAWSVNKIQMMHGQYSGEHDYIGPNKIVISFEVREYNTQSRQQIIQDVIKWACGGGWLKCSDRNSQKIYVKPTVFPAVTSAMKWLDRLTVEFTAFDFPFWQDITPQTVTIAQGETSTLTALGTRTAYVEAEITAIDDLTSVTVACGDTEIELSGIDIDPNKKIYIVYSDDHHILSIKSGNVSLLGKRTTTSNDDLLAEPGENNVSFSASGNASCTLSVKGLYV